MERKHFTTLAMVLISFLLLILGATASAHPADTTYRSKSELIQIWKTLCDQHPSQASYEVIGHSVQGREIYLFKIGNPSGGKVMMDSSCHGDEDAGAELGYVFAKWLLESTETQARRILNNNYMLFIPVLNVDSSSRQNMRRSYTFDNGTNISVPYGVDLNRNAVYGWTPDSPTNNYDYHGPVAGSEPETQAWRNACNIYHPAIYLNQHQGAFPQLGHRSNTALEQTILSSMRTYAQQLGVTPYQDTLGAGGGTIAADADENFGASGWIIEIYQWWTGSEPTYDQLISQYYPRVKALYMAMANAVEIEQPLLPPGSGATVAIPTQGMIQSP